jgi:hypothetical protein
MSCAQNRMCFIWDTNFKINSIQQVNSHHPTLACGILHFWISTVAVMYSVCVLVLLGTSHVTAEIIDQWLWNSLRLFLHRPHSGIPSILLFEFRKQSHTITLSCPTCLCVSLMLRFVKPKHVLNFHSTHYESHTNEDRISFAIINSSSSSSKD